MTQQTFTVDYGLSIIDNSPGGGSVTGNDGAVVVTASDLANTAAWTFDPTGNLTLPSNTASINYANGTPYGSGGGGANTGNIAFSGTAIEIAPGASETNINISPDTEGWAFVQLPNDATANTANTRVVNAAGNVTIETGDFSTGGSNVSTWAFDNTGGLTLPGNLGANNASITSINAGEIVGLNSQANGIVGIKAYGSAANLVAGVAVNGGDSETDRVTVSVFNPAIDDNEYWSFNTAGDFTTGMGNIFFGTNVGDAVIVPGSSSIKIAADRSDLTTSYVNITNSGITIDALGGSTADITLRAADDIILRGGDKTSAPGQRGGDINIEAGQGGPDNGIDAGDGGDVNIIGGFGGEALAGGPGRGGDAALVGGPGSTANVTNSISAGRGGAAIIQGGNGGQNADAANLSAQAGNVEIYGGLGSFDSANGVPSGDPGHVNLYGGNWGFISPSGNIYLNTYQPTTFYTWQFDNAGVLTLPGEGVVRSNNDTVVIQSYDTANAAGYGMYVGTQGGLYFQQASDPVWLSIVPNASNVEIAAGVAEGGAAGHNISISAGDADQTNYFTTAGGNVNITGGLGAFNDGGGGGPGGSINISAGNSSDPAGHPGNVTVNTGSYTWNFDYNGTLNLPEGTAYIGSAANALTLHANDSEAIYISAISGGISAETNGNITLISNVDGVTNYAWTFDNTGNLTAPGIVTANTFVSNAYNVLTAGNLSITSQYGLGTTGTILEDNGDLEVYGSGSGGAIVGWTNNYSTLGNVATVNFNTVDSPGNILVRTGNRAVTEYNWIFDKTGNLAAPGAISAAGNVTAGNISTAGLITATGNITAGNVNTGGRISATGNILGGNLTVAGNATITYTPATAVGYGITVNAANTQGGTGYADFLRATNTSGGATNPNKSFRLSSAGALEIINSAYSATLLSLSDAGAMSAALPYQVAGKQAVNGPAFSAYAAAILQNIPNGTQTKVLFQTEEFDTNNNYASSRFTPTVEGYYQLNAEVRLDGATGTGECMIILYKNGSEYKRGWNSSGTQFASSFWAMQVSSVAYANGSGDYFEIYVQQGSGGTISVTAVNAPAITWFNGCMLRGA